MTQPSVIELLAQQWDGFWAMQLYVCVFFVLCFVEAAVTTPRPPPKPTPDLVTDMFYWLALPTVRAVSRMVGVLLLLAMAIALGVDAGPALLDGFGPVARQPQWLIVIELLLLMDLSLYWVHRAFHRVPWLWRFHAIHHSPKFVRWSSTGRVHPVNELVNYLVAVVPFFALGFPLGSVLVLMPLVSLWVISVHTQWNYTLGPLGKVLVSPRFHRWHHTHSEQGGNMNFANVFSLWDRVFGTYYLPQGQIPERFGLDEDDVAESFVAQLVYPFRRPGTTAHEQTEQESVVRPAELGATLNPHRLDRPREGAASTHAS